MTFKKNWCKNLHSNISL